MRLIRFVARHLTMLRGAFQERSSHFPRRHPEVLARRSVHATCSHVLGGPASKGDGTARATHPSRLGASRLAPQDDGMTGLGPSLRRSWTNPERVFAVQALPTGNATNLVWSPDFTRIRIVCLPWACASCMALRTSDGVATVLPPTSRITSPVRKPRSAAGPSGSTWVTTTPALPAPATFAAGASDRPSGPTLLPGLVSPGPGWTRACWVFGNSPSVSVSAFSSPLRQTPSLAEVPGAIELIFLASSRAFFTGWPSTAVITLPFTSKLGPPELPLFPGASIWMKSS